ncbi:NAD-dependent epimerase/dehydratase family protein [Haliea sp. E17]|uniref:NAD-dependent epimerase/dehydratase family protein n=1 Tax=Haliea sp. E17 TaxID=3401576 RepID=UPI003AAE0A23
MIARGNLIALTGATGFIGGWICRELLQRGYRLRALVRNPDAACRLAALGIDTVRGDLHDPPALDALLAGSAGVVHAAATVRGASWADFETANVAGTARLLAAVQKLETSPRLLFLSSLAAREPQLSWYARSKSEAEALLGEAGDVDWLVLRPPAVYGPGDREMLPLLKLMARGLAPVPGSLDARFSLIHAQDLVRAVADGLAADVAGQVLTLDDGHAGGYSWPELARIVEQLTGRPVRLLQVPEKLLDLVAGINVRTARLSGRLPMLSPGKLRELRYPDWVVDNAGIGCALGWRPAIGLAEGLAPLLRGDAGA